MRLRRAPKPSVSVPAVQAERHIPWDGVRAAAGPSAVIHAARASELSQQTAA